MIIRKLLAAFVLMFAVVPSPVVSAHGGGLDGSGGHNCNVGSCAGTYHCHRPSWGCGGGYQFASPTPVLPSICVSLFSSKMSKSDVLLIQMRLSLNGSNPGSLDGIFGSKTQAAINKYEAIYGLQRSPKNSIYHSTLKHLNVDC